MDEGMRNFLVDVSSFMLFEATGDSEFDSYKYSTNHVDGHDYTHLVDDDAMSICSSECSSSSDHKVQIYENDLEMELDAAADDDDATSSAHVDRGVKCFKNEDDEEDEDDDEDVVEQPWIGHGGGYCKKSKARDCGDLVKDKFKNQKDEDRHFWEICLAS